MNLRINRARARTTDPQTSHDAADSVANLRASQQAVLTVLRSCRKGLTDNDLITTYDALAASLSLPRQSPSGLRSRRNELTRVGLVVDTGQREVLPTGRKAIVWAAWTMP